jgi:hypothetical protein
MNERTHTRNPSLLLRFFFFSYQVGEQNFGALAQRTMKQKIAAVILLVLINIGAIVLCEFFFCVPSFSVLIRARVPFFF